MAKTLRVIFDGDVLRPESLVALQPNTWYEATLDISIIAFIALV